MIVRKVKMYFRADTSKIFIEKFRATKHLILASDGCLRLSLLKDEHQDHVLYTLSEWVDQDALDNYRKSPLFGTVWPDVKKLFSAKAEVATYFFIE